jgi:hypothetical protein
MRHGWLVSTALLRSALTVVTYPRSFCELISYTIGLQTLRLYFQSELYNVHTVHFKGDYWV